MRMLLVCVCVCSLLCSLLCPALCGLWGSLSLSLCCGLWCAEGSRWSGGVAWAGGWGARRPSGGSSGSRGSGYPLFRASYPYCVLVNTRARAQARNGTWDVPIRDPIYPILSRGETEGIHHGPPYIPPPLPRKGKGMGMCRGMVSPPSCPH